MRWNPPARVMVLVLGTGAMLTVAGCFPSGQAGGNAATATTGDAPGVAVATVDNEQPPAAPAEITPQPAEIVAQPAEIVAQPDDALGEGQFDEPAGISYAAGKLYIADTNNHRIRVVDLQHNNAVSTLEIAGLAPPPMPPEPPLPAVETAAAETDVVEPATETPPTGEEPAAEPVAEAEAAAAADESDPRSATPRPPAPKVAAGEADAEDDLAELEGLSDPFPETVLLPFDFPDDAQWLNTDKPLKLADLKGKFVLIDFWTYCCINCIHILPELKKLERAFPNDLVVIGVHSAKFETEKGLKNIEEAILRYEIEHPVVNDPDHQIWTMFGARSWPTIALIDPQGRFIGKLSGEIQAQPFIDLLKKTLPYYHEKGLSNTTPLKFDLLKDKQHPSPLRFPGKVLADEKSQRLFIADSNHNRIVIASLAGELIDTIGTGAIGKQDGAFTDATFNKPQGMAVIGETLYVADTENHLLRRIDLKEKQVTTIAGTGEQGRNAWPGADEAHRFGPPPDRYVSSTPHEFAINSPWALWIHGSDLYIAMAGPHQIWKMPLDESEIGPYAGNGREDIVDGPLLPPTPYAQGYSSFAQPSGLASDGRWLYVADSEGSSIRAVPFDTESEVETIIGTDQLESGRLFEFGHRDGQGSDVLLQHPLGVAYHDGKIYVADTYNDAIKEIDIASRTCKTIAGTPPLAPTENPATEADLTAPAAEGETASPEENTSEIPPSPGGESEETSPASEPTTSN